MMEYKLIRSKRRTLSVSITEGGVTVKAPAKMSEAHIQAFLEKKSRWIEKKLAEQRQKTNALSAVISGEAALYHGCELKIQPSQTHKRITFGVGTLYVPQKYADIAARTRAVAAFFKRLAAAELSESLAATSELAGLPYAAFALTNARTKWGSCDGKCNIRLNWRLIMLDPELTEYVMLHELAHTVHHDHSAAFWAEVGKRFPDYKAANKRLKSYSALTSLYR